MRPAKILPKELLATCKISNHHRRPVLPPVRFAGMTYGMGSNEHTLEQHACFKEYLTLYEDRLADYIGNTFALGSGVGGWSRAWGLRESSLSRLITPVSA